MADHLGRHDTTVSNILGKYAKIRGLIPLH
jgi:hypothetical protein